MDVVEDLNNVYLALRLLVSIQIVSSKRSAEKFHIILTSKQNKWSSLAESLHLYSPILTIR